MKLKITDHLRDMNDVVGWAFIQSMLAWEEKNPRVKHEDSPFHSTDGILEVRLTVNGVEVPFDCVLEEYGRQMDQMIEEKAASLLKSRASKMMDILSRMEHELEATAEELFPKTWKEDGYY